MPLRASRVARLAVAGACAIGGNASALAQDSVRQSAFEVRFGEAGITSLRSATHPEAPDFLAEGETLGPVLIRYRAGGGPWQEGTTLESDGEGALELTSRFLPDSDSLRWTLRIRNRSTQTLEVGDIALTLPFNTEYVGRTRHETYTMRLIEHRFVGKHGSFFYWVRANGAGPYLVMTPHGNTAVEYFDSAHDAYIRSAARGAEETRGSWREGHTSVTLARAGQPGDYVEYGFTFRWADDLNGVRDILYQSGGFDVHVVPGMVVPQDLSARFSVRTKNAIDSVTAEHPETTRLEYLGDKGDGTHLYQVAFSRIGENALTIHYGNGKHSTLEFFSTEPLETLIKKRARFIAEKQQHRNPETWYDGLFSLWSMEDTVLLGPDNTGGLHPYMVGGSDDPSNSKPAYLSEKNVVFPDSVEIRALEYHLEHFVWGGLQRTAEEHPHPYGIYGSDNWHLNRTTRWGTTDPARVKSYEERYGDPEGTGLGAERMWRTFDYTTYILVYHNMYRIAKQYPDMVRYLDADGYLDRAFGTAKAFFEVPYSIYMPGPPLWSHTGYSDWAYKQGNFHEKYIVDLIAALKAEGRTSDAAWLEAEWEKKVKYFLYDEPYPYGSEMAFDRTAFESTHAVAKYAVAHGLEADTLLWRDKNTGEWYSHPHLTPETVHADARAFMDRQIRANIALRGWLQPAYHLLGSAWTTPTYTLEYMSQMGGWAILDYALSFAEDPDRYLRLGYASLLSSWALVNAGPASSGDGYWYPGEANDGAVGWGFNASKYAETWLHRSIGRGVWPYDGEIDHGLTGYVNAAATVVVDDSIFGLFAYGGDARRQDGTIRVVPRDGVRQRIHVIGTGTGAVVQIRLDRDGFAGGEPLVLSDGMDRVELVLQNRTADRHATELRLAGFAPGTYGVWVNGTAQRGVSIGRDPAPVTVVLELGAEPLHQVRIERVRRSALD